MKPIIWPMPDRSSAGWPMFHRRTGILPVSIFFACEFFAGHGFNARLFRGILSPGQRSQGEVDRKIQLYTRRHQFTGSTVTSTNPTSGCAIL